MALTVKEIQNLEIKPKRYRKADGLGLYVDVRPNGVKSFVFRVQMKHIGLDTYTGIGKVGDISLSDARAKRDEYRKLVADGINPIEHQQQQQKEKRAKEQAKAQRLTFSELFNQWHDHNEGDWSYKYATDIRNRSTMHLLPTLGYLFVDEITPQQIIYTLKQMEAKGLGHSIKKAKQIASRVFRYGVGLGLCAVDPVRDIPVGDIFKKAKKENLHHLTKPEDLYQLLNALDAYLGDIATATALKLAPHVFLRPIELSSLRWDEVTLRKSKLGNATLAHGYILIEGERMKMSRPHVVPLSRQANELLKVMKAFKNSSPFVFPSPRNPNRPIHRDSLGAGLHRIGFKGKQTAHGFRHTASTLLNEQGFNRDWVEMQLAHNDGDSVRGTYNKAEYLTDRARMMQAWSDYLDALKNGADIIPIGKNKNVNA